MKIPILVVEILTLHCGDFDTQCGDYDCGSQGRNNCKYFNKYLCKNNFHEIDLKTSQNSLNTIFFMLEYLKIVRRKDDTAILNGIYNFKCALYNLLIDALQIVSSSVK